MQNILYDELEIFMDWIKTKVGLKFNPHSKTFPIIPNCIYETLALTGKVIKQSKGNFQTTYLHRSYDTALVFAKCFCFSKIKSFIFPI